MPFEVLLHSRVEAELRGLRGEGQRWKTAVDTAIRKLLSDPHGAGEALRGIAEGELQGTIYRLRVGGRRGYRLFYWLPRLRRGSELVLAIPIYLSEELRGDFDYDDIDVNAVGMDVVEDYRDGKFGQFKRFRDATVLCGYLE